jgi:hypothetical protein
MIVSLTDNSLDVFAHYYSFQNWKEEGQKYFESMAKNRDGFV